MTGFRLKTGGEIDRARPVTFTFDGESVTGFAGDTYASALMASGHMVMGRSFKYRRRRGLWGAGVEEPNVWLDITCGAGFAPGRRATTEPAQHGAVTRAATASPSAERDATGAFDWFGRFIPSGFYYKTFMWPDWHLFERHIRAQAGIGTVRRDFTDVPPADRIHHHCDLLVVGAGPVGLAAAVMAAEAGARVMLVDEQDRAGGSLLAHPAVIDGQAAPDWLAAALARLAAAGARVLMRATAFGSYDHGLVAVNQRHDDGRSDTMWQVRPHHVLLATGAIDRPLPFANNDLPGIMSAEAALVYLRRYAVAPGRRVVVATSNNRTGAVAQALAEAGVAVTLVDARADATAPAGIALIRSRIIEAHGRRGVRSVTLADGQRIDCDAVLVSGGLTPTIHLYAQARGKPAWDAEKAAFVPGSTVAGMTLAGAAAGQFTLAGAFAALPEALAPLGLPLAAAPVTGAAPRYEIAAMWPEPGEKGRVWIDLQHDVTAKDVELAARENFTSVEHLKRYTTLGMATDQGKTSNLAGLALMGALTGRTVPQVGTTTYRPPYTPVPYESFAAGRRGVRFNPVKRLALESAHRAAGAVLREYGGWLRPAFYGTDDSAILIEAKQARESAALFDGSTLGKIEVMGPQAEDFLEFVYYNSIRSLKPGRGRYCFVLSETGVVFDDGVLLRLAPDHFIVSCSSSHVDGMRGLLEEWRQDRFDPSRVFIHDATQHWATLTVSGPQARAIIAGAGVEADLSDDVLPHMAIGAGRFGDQPLRIARVSFTGDRSYEISIRATQAAPLWAALRQAGSDHGAVLLGMEALTILRAEKGYLIIGKDTDGTTLPQDLGLTGPLAKKSEEFIGRRSLILPDAADANRRQFTGIEVTDGLGPLPCGAHGVEDRDGRPRSLGYVTSSYFSPTLDRPIALGLIERAQARQGEEIAFQHLGQRRRGRLVAPCFLDPDGGRLHG
ncbi:MAG: (2Fe-2S)-binding protein [Rubellimicrobium sp.]|nr:(2Fe-2S)-binding protein [Rubellimicrobium sp.]